MRTKSLILGASVLMLTGVVIIGGLSQRTYADTLGWQTNGDNVYVTGTKVGIGTNDPQYALDITDRLMRVQGDLPVIILDDTRDNGNWAIYSGSPNIGDFKIRDNNTGSDRLVIESTGYLNSNTRLLRVRGNQPALIIDDLRNSGGGWALFDGSPDVGGFKLRDNNQGKDKFVIYPSGEICIGNC